MTHERRLSPLALYRLRQSVLPRAPLRHAALVSGRGHTKILVRHCAKLAVVYVRQSSLQQVWDNRESTARQYALHDYAVALGWPATRVLIIDEDQGQSAASTQGRPGFQRLLAEVTMNHVGLVLGLEMSRAGAQLPKTGIICWKCVRSLARSSRIRMGCTMRVIPMIGSCWA